MSKAPRSSPTSLGAATQSAAVQPAEATALPSIATLGRRVAALTVEYDQLDDLSLTVKGSAPVDLHYAELVIRAQRDALQALIATIPAVTIEDAAVQIATANHLVSDLTDRGLRELETEQASAAMDRLLLSALPVMAAAAGLDMDAMGWDDLARLRTIRFAGVEGVR